MARNKKYLQKITIFLKKADPIISIELKAEFQFFIFLIFLLILTCDINFKLNKAKKI